MDREYYVTLTGGKNNAGDFLIKHRAFNLFKALREDRDIVDFNEWEPLDDKKLEIINKSKALILLGGPGILPSMYPTVYKLRENLDDIKVPIIMMGLGWKDAQGDWENSYSIQFDSKTTLLLDRIKEDGFLSSVRDYHTLNTLQINGYQNILMTGCPAYYDMHSIRKSVQESTIEKVAFSLGVSFVNSSSMEHQMKEVILTLKKRYSKQKFEVVFHHSLESSKIKKAYGTKSSQHIKKHLEFATWLEQNSIEYSDISGSAENLIEYYLDVDLHIGYRVHAHIFMNSISKRSILLNEDGRGKGVDKVLGGTTITAYKKYKKDILSKVLSRLVPTYDRVVANEYLKEELFNALNYEQANSYPSARRSRSLIDTNFISMKKFIEQLP